MGQEEGGNRMWGVVRRLGHSPAVGDTVAEADRGLGCLGELGELES